MVVDAVRVAYHGLDVERESVVLLGNTPDKADSSPGWRDVMMKLYLQTLPSLLKALTLARAWDARLPEADAARQAYARLQVSDLSPDVLDRSTDSLRVLPVPPCGWSDLGTPERLARCTARLMRPEAALPTRGVADRRAAASYRRNAPDSPFQSTFPPGSGSSGPAAPDKGSSAKWGG